MLRRDVVVVGASSGGLEVLRGLTAGLPRDLQASVLVVLHMSPSSPSVLPTLLQRGCALPVAFAEDGAPLERGHVYVARPDRHLVVEPGRLRVTRAPRENFSRPAIDPLFRSAAVAYGARVIGVIASGRLDDGTAGLWAVKERGGTVVVQDPDDALHGEMPRNALQYTAADHVVRAGELAPLLARLVALPVPGSAEGPVSRELALDVRIAMEDDALHEGVLALGAPSPYTCPECHAVLIRVEGRGVPRFRCHTGHAFSVDSLLASVTGSVEATLWSALRAVEQSVMLLREAAARTSAGADVDPRFERTAREAEAQAARIREVVLRHQALSLESVRSAGAHGSAHGSAPAD